MIRRIRLAIFSLLTLITLFAVPVVSAHPLGNFTINHYDGIHVTPNSFTVDYVLDMAEIPAFQEMSLLPKDPDGMPDPAALPAYASRQCLTITPALLLQEDGKPVALSLTGSRVTFPPGAAGLSTLRLTCTLRSASLAPFSNNQVDFKDGSFSDRIGWREIVVFPEGVPLRGDFATQSVSSQLTSYPQDMLSSPLDVRQVSLKAGALAAAPQSAPAAKLAGPATAPWASGARSDNFTQLITLQDMTPASILLALLIAFVWGGLHSMTPGHGKTIVGAYLVGSRGTALHAVYLGMMTTLTHTAGVFLLGLITLFASRYILPDQLFPWISVLSGVLVVVIGVVLFIGRLRATRAWAALLHRITKHPAPAPAFAAAARPTLKVNFLPSPKTKRFGEFWQRFAAKTPRFFFLPSPLRFKGGQAPYPPAPFPQIGGHPWCARRGEGSRFSPFLGGMPPKKGIKNAPPPSRAGAGGWVKAACPPLNPLRGSTRSSGRGAGDGEALAPHPHAVGMHQHSDGTLHTHTVGMHQHSDGTLHTHAVGMHQHSDGTLHTHLPPGADGSKVTLRSLLALGISGGLLPCPSALVVMLGAIALNRIAFGILLVLVFSLGLASVLTAIGLVMVYARRFFEKLPVHSRFIELIPAGSALFIMLLGLGITLQALIQLGWLTI